MDSHQITVRSVALVGVDAAPLTVTAERIPGDTWEIIGLPDSAVRETVVRVRGALRASDYQPPKGVRVVVACAVLPDLRLDGTPLDLPIALAVLALQGAIPEGALDGVLAAGELGLDGRLRPVRGVVPAAEWACAENYLLVVPADCAAEADLIEGTHVCAPHSLSHAVTLLQDRHAGASVGHFAPGVTLGERPNAPCFSEVRGHADAIRQLEEAAVAGRSVLLVGPPGSGKTMLARRFAGILPALTEAEAVEVARVQSASGLGVRSEGVRPFRAPHHTVSHAGLWGGGALVRPGEATLAHRGVLFLDDVPEFRRDVLEPLRGALRDKAVTVHRSGGTVRLPADFALIASACPCPCGFRGPVRCVCTRAQIERWEARLAPLRELFDVVIRLEPVTYATLSAAPASETSATIRARVEARRAAQAAQRAAQEALEGLAVRVRQCEQSPRRAAFDFSAGGIVAWTTRNLTLDADAPEVWAGGVVPGTCIRDALRSAPLEVDGRTLSVNGAPSAAVAVAQLRVILVGGDSDAERVADLFSDGESFLTDDGRGLHYVCIDAGAEHVRTAHGSRYIFADRSVIVVVGDAWDVGLSPDCNCWAGANGGRHADGCAQASQGEG